MQLETVWLIDDDPDSHFLLSRIFRRSGVCAEPRAFLNPQHAIQTFQEQCAEGRPRPELAVVDMNMPYCNGPECIHQLASIAAEHGLSPIPSLLLTNALPYGIEEQLKDCPGFLGMREKPLNAQQLQELLETLWKP